MKKSTFAFLLVIIILIIDQYSKVWVKTNMLLGDEIFIFGWSWARIHFVENPGMAFGMSFGGDIGKLILSLFRIGMIGFLIYYVSKLIKTNISYGIIGGVTFVLAGAIGNIVDGAFYDVIFTPTSFGSPLSEYIGFGGGQGDFLHGKVVDMFYFPMLSGHFYDWIPFIGGKPFLFFEYIFNVADSAVFVGVTYMLIFQRKFISGE